MPRGGLRKGNKSESNHLFKPKWNNKKTTAIRIPETFKNTLLFIARYLDNLKESSKIQELILSDIHYLELYKSETKKYEDKFEKLEQDKENFLKQINELTKKNERNDKNKYQLSVECFQEYLKSQNLNIEELSKSRKGSKKHQLFEINEWFKSQCSN